VFAHCCPTSTTTSSGMTFLATRFPSLRAGTYPLLPDLPRLKHDPTLGTFHLSGTDALDLCQWNRVAAGRTRRIQRGHDFGAVYFILTHRITLTCDAIHENDLGELERQTARIGSLSSSSKIPLAMTYTCPHCGQDSNDPKADLFDTIRIGRLMCAHCAREFLVVNDVPMTEEQYRQSKQVH
jgi:hypothetical protein